MSVQGFAKTPDTDDDAYFNAVGPDFFQAIGIPLLAGREFTRSDVVGSPKVAIVNESFAKKFELGRGAVGKMIGEGDKLDIQIVGLVKDARYSGVKQDMRPCLLPTVQAGQHGRIDDVLCAEQRADDDTRAGAARGRGEARSQSSN